MDAGMMSAKNVTFIGIMGALGNVLSGLTILLVPLLPHVPLGPYSISIALDLSHLTTFTAALYGGPTIGGLTGLIGGLVAANEFGFSKGNLVTGFALPVGKALTGITGGLIMEALGLQEKGRRRIFIIAWTLLSYIPEAIFTTFLFLVIFPFAFGTPAHFLYPIVITIHVKASIEMFAAGIVLVALSSNQGFTGLIKRFFQAS